MNFLVGKKTYIVGIGALLVDIGLFMQGQESLDTAIQLAVTALLGMFIRSGITSDVNGGVSK